MTEHRVHISAHSFDVQKFGGISHDKDGNLRENWHTLAYCRNHRDLAQALKRLGLSPILAAGLPDMHPNVREAIDGFGMREVVRLDPVRKERQAANAREIAKQRKR